MDSTKTAQEALISPRLCMYCKHSRMIKKTESGYECMAGIFVSADGNPGDLVMWTIKRYQSMRCEQFGRDNQ